MLPGLKGLKGYGGWKPHEPEPKFLFAVWANTSCLTSLKFDFTVGKVKFKILEHVPRQKCLACYNNCECFRILWGILKRTGLSQAWYSTNFWVSSHSQFFLLLSVVSLWYTISGQQCLVVVSIILYTLAYYLGIMTFMPGNRYKPKLLHVNQMS